MISIQARTLQLLLRLAPRVDPAKLQPADIRKLAARADRWFARAPKGVVIEDGQIAGIRMRRVRPLRGEVSGTIFLLHGGAWCIETPNLHTGLAARLALALGSEAVMPHYRLAPEFPFPAATLDCQAAWSGLMESGVRAGDVVLLGDSAGGALALGLLGQLRDSGQEMPACALLMSPATDLATMGRSIIDNEKKDAMFGVTTMLLFRHWYLGETAPTNPLASPYWADFTGFPPLFFQVSGSEMMLDNSLLAEAKARRQGVKTQIRVWPDMPHDFSLFPSLPEATGGIEELVRFAKENSLVRQSV